MSKHGNDPNTSGDAEVTGERPWHRRSRLYDREAGIRALIAEGYSLRQVIQRLDLRVSRSALWRFLRRTADPAARLAGEPAPAAAAPSAAWASEVAADDAAAEALLATIQFFPPTRKVPPR
jgi:hypothetical protein